MVSLIQGQMTANEWLGVWLNILYNFPSDHWLNRVVSQLSYPFFQELYLLGDLTLSLYPFNEAHDFYLVIVGDPEFYFLDGDALFGWNVAHEFTLAYLLFKGLELGGSLQVARLLPPTLQECLEGLPLRRVLKRRDERVKVFGELTLVSWDLRVWKLHCRTRSYQVTRGCLYYWHIRGNFRLC